MSDFSDNDINEAKRRVWEMRNKAAHFVDDNHSNVSSNQTPAGAPPIFNKPPLADNSASQNKKEPESSSDNGKDEDRSFMVILVLIMLLSHEGADNTLILALLYLLL